MGRPRKDEARDTRREILNSALDLFGQDGFLGVSMRQIAQAVGVRESALYHHFPSKDAILLALFEEMGPSKVELLAHVDVDAVIAHGVEKTLRTVAQAVMEDWATPRERQFMRLMMSEVPRLPPESALQLPSAIDRAVQIFARFFEALMKKGVIEKRPAELVAVEWMAPLMMSRIRFMVVNPGPVDLERVKALVDQHVTYFWESVRKKGAKK